MLRHTYDHICPPTYPWPCIPLTWLLTIFTFGPPHHPIVPLPLLFTPTLFTFSYIYPILHSLPYRMLDLPYPITQCSHSPMDTTTLCFTFPLIASYHTLLHFFHIHHPISYNFALHIVHIPLNSFLPYITPLLSHTSPKIMPFPIKHWSHSPIYTTIRCSQYPW